MTTARVTAMSSDGGDGGRDSRGGSVSLEKFLVSVLDERTKANEQRFICVEHDLVKHDLAVALARKEADAAILAAMTNVKEATLKDEAAAKERVAGLEAQVNAGIGNLHAKLDAAERTMNDKLQVALAQIQLNKGRDSGIGLAWIIAVGVVGVVGTVVGIAGFVINVVRH